MAKATIGFGILLIVVGSWGFFATGSQHPTALIPAYFGLVLFWSGVLAIKPERRALWMHIAVTAGLLGFLGAAVQAIREYVAAHGAPLAETAAVAVRYQTAMAGICLAFVLLCVRSFIAARRGRNLEA
jgi:uncharacterized membrane protein (UPF0136 family)